MDLPFRYRIWIGLISFCVSADAAVITRGPYLQSAGPDRITVCWRTDEPVTSELATGPDTTSFGPATSVPGNRTDHFVTLTGLQPSARYFYRITGTPLAATAPVNLSGPDYWFETSPPASAAAPLRMWVIGDSGSHPGFAPYAEFYAPSVALYQAYRNATAAAGKSTHLWMMLGDNAYNLGTDTEYQAAVFNKYPEMLRNSVLWSAIGNHDISSVAPPYTATAPYESILHFPQAGECGGLPSGSERYYSFNRGNVHFITLDSVTPANVNSTAGSGGMLDWLVNDLKATTADWIIVYFHDAPYSVGSHFSDSEPSMKAMREKYGPILESHDVDLVLAGHSHTFERSGLISGHYGTSGTWSETMRKQAGNGSDVGGVTATGSFTHGSPHASGAYQKPIAIPNMGTVYAVVGSSGSLSNWGNVSPALVAPTPHPANVVSLRLMGGLAVEIDGGRMNCQYLDQVAAIRDDFTLLKGSTYTLQGAVPAADEGLSGIAFPVTREGATHHAEQVPVAVDVISGTGVSPAQGIAEFAAGQSSALVKFFPSEGDPTTRIEARLLATSQSVQIGSAPRSAYRISGAPQAGQFAGTPAATWYASRFGVEPAGPEVWSTDDDGDGLPLLIEYALGGEPDRNDVALLPKGQAEGDTWVYRYVRAAGRSDIDYSVLISNDPTVWQPAGGLDVSDGPATALEEPRRVSLPISQDAGFVRLRVTLTP
jgi:hypothetical protein